MENKSENMIDLEELTEMLGLNMAQIVRKLIDMNESPHSFPWPALITSKKVLWKASDVLRYILNKNMMKSSVLIQKVMEEYKNKDVGVTPYTFKKITLHDLRPDKDEEIPELPTLI